MTKGRPVGHSTKWGTKKSAGFPKSYCETCEEPLYTSKQIANKYLGTPWMPHDGELVEHEFSGKHYCFPHMLKKMYPKKSLRTISGYWKKELGDVVCSFYAKELGMK
ncbi:MAG: hypothetical protein WCP97_00630 [bacterium]